MTPIEYLILYLLAGCIFYALGKVIALVFLRIHTPPKNVPPSLLLWSVAWPVMAPVVALLLLIVLVGKLVTWGLE